MNSSSDRLKNSIIGALNEERKPQSIRYLKTFSFAVALSFGLAAILWGIWPSNFNSVIVAVSFSLFILFSAGFVLYFYPQPRILVPGFWMPWMWGRLLILMGIISTVELILCPDLAGIFGIESLFPWLAQITHIFMNLGGMKICMLACGILFSGIASLLVLFSLRKVLSQSRMKWILAAAFFVFVGQTPVIVCQAMNQTEYLGFWMVGSFIAIFMTEAMFRWIPFKNRLD